MVVPGRLSKWKVGIGTSGSESQSDPKKCSSCFCCRQCIGVNGAESETIRMTKESENSVAQTECTRVKNEGLVAMPVVLYRQNM